MNETSAKEMREECVTKSYRERVALCGFKRFSCPISESEFALREKNAKKRNATKS